VLFSAVPFAEVPFADGLVGARTGVLVATIRILPAPVRPASPTFG
jgi:hypothetical protein